MQCNRSNTRPIGPRPRDPLTSYLERSSGNITIHQGSPNTKNMNHSRQENHKSKQYDNSCTDESSESGDEDLLFKSTNDEWQTSMNKSANGIGTKEQNSIKYISKSVKYTTCEKRIHSGYISVPKSAQNVKSGTLVAQASPSQMKFKQKIEIKSHDRNYRFFIFLLAILGMVGALFISYFNHTESRNTTDNVDLEILLEELDKAVETLGQQFPQQDPYTWYEIIPSIKNVVQNQNKPSMIILFANESYTMNCLARALATVSIRALQTSSFLTLTRENMGDNLGNILIALKPQIEEKRVVIVQDLLNLHPQVIRAFHNLCDRENPFIKKAVYIFTAIVNVHDRIENPLEYIENEISKKFATIDNDILTPLVTRLTEGPAVQVVPEEDQHYCTSI